MTRLGEWIETSVRWTNKRIVSHPGPVVVAFLVMTVVLAAGMPLIQTSSDVEDTFTEGIPEQEAYDSIQDEFEDPFTNGEETTQLIHTGSDVLTRQALLDELRLLERIDTRDDLRMDSANGPATSVAQALDPGAETIAEQRRALDGATDREVRRTIRELATNPQFSRTLSNDFNGEEATASASITIVSHDVPPSFGDDELQDVQLSIDALTEDANGDIRAYGTGVMNAELNNIIGDSMTMVMPVVLLLLLAFLVVAYRDPFDLTLGLVGLVMTIIWTFGFLGYSGIPFSQQMIIVPVLLLAVGVDFGIHVVNRYREETVEGAKPIPAMETATNQLAIAFLIVTVTAVIGFGANLVSDLQPIRELGIALSVGIVFTYFIFGWFLPAAKLLVDRLRENYGVPEFGSDPISSEDSALGRVLAMSATVGRHAPLLLVLAVILLSAGAGAYGSGVDTTFDQESFLPPEEEAGYVDYFPAALQPGEYTVTETLNLLEDRFETNIGQSLLIYVEGPFEEAHALEALTAPDDSPPSSLAVGEGGQADAQSIVTVIQSAADRNPKFAALVERNDRNGDGVPDRNLDRIYDELFASPMGDRASQYLADDRRGAKIEYSVKADASQEEISADGAEHAESFRYAATATGQTVIFAAISDILFESAIQGMVLALLLTAIFLVVVYGVLEGKPGLGVVNVLPIGVAVTFLLGTMRALGMSLNGLTTMILSIAIGLGVAYSVHITHRFTDEYNDRTDALEALRPTLSGTGGALAGSMLTTSIGTGALALAITPVLGDFGLLIALSVFYSFIASILVLPPGLFLWDRFNTSEKAGFARLAAIVVP